MRSISNGGSLTVQKAINYDYSQFNITPMVYSQSDIEAMNDKNGLPYAKREGWTGGRFGQGWSVTFGDAHICRGAVIMSIYEVTPARQWLEDVDKSVRFAVSNYYQPLKGQGGMWFNSVLMPDFELSSLLSDTERRLTLLPLECRAAQKLYRETLHTFLWERDPAGVTLVPTKEVSYHFHCNDKGLYR